MSNPAEHSEEHQEFVQEAIRTQKIESAISRTLESSKLRHQGERADAVRAIMKKLSAVPGTEFRISDRNWLVASRDGQPLNLQNEVDQILLMDRSIGDPASVQQAVAAGELDVEARSDLSTAAQKVAFVAKYGYDKWAALPQHRTAKVENYDTMTAAQLKSLPLSVKCKLTEQQISNALRRK